ncbi:MAG: hypothetical protein ABUT39_28340 [Acidobacteriota bacterium]
MAGDGSFLVEEFIDSITSQLDRVQDSLRVKAVNRPLTYALKDMSLELKVFVELDTQGKVRFRTSGPNEAGASVVQLGFTTITKPMIEENTVSLAANRSPSLEEAGLAPDERLRLERMGVRNVGQLERLQSSAGVQSVARLAEVPVDRLRSALVLNRPKVTGVRPLPPQPAPPVVRPAPPVQPAPPVPRPAPPAPPLRVPAPPPRTPSLPSRPPAGPPVLKVQPGTRRIALSGNRLIGDDGPASVRLNNQPLGVSEADDDRIVIEMPEDHRGGALEISLPDGTVAAYELSVEDGESWGAWAPDEEYS